MAAIARGTPTSVATEPAVPSFHHDGTQRGLLVGGGGSCSAAGYPWWLPWRHLPLVCPGCRGARPAWPSPARAGPSSRRHPDGGRLRLRCPRLGSFWLGDD